MSQESTNRCEDCVHCQFDGEPKALEAKCTNLPVNIDFGWSMGAIPYGRFVSKIDHLKPCPLWKGGLSWAAMEHRADIIDRYRDWQREAGHPNIDEMCNRVREKITPHSRGNRNDRPDIRYATT